MSTTPLAVDTVTGSDSLRASGSPRLLRRVLTRKVAVGSLVWILMLILIAIVAPIAMPWVEGQRAGNLFAINQGPSAAHLLGTDSLGRDVLERLLVGTRASLVAVAEALVVMLAVSVPVGVAAAYVGGALDRSVGWIVDLSLALPGLIILIVVATVFPDNTLMMMVIFGVLSAPGTIRLVRAAVLPVREELYVAAARVSGLTRPYIMARHIVPRIYGVLIVTAALFAAGVLLVEAGLAFLGLMDAPPAPSWGGMLGDGTQNIVANPWLIWPPGVTITLAILAFGFVGDALGEATAETWQSSGPRRKGQRALFAFLALRRPKRAAVASNGGVAAAEPAPSTSFPFTTSAIDTEGAARPPARTSKPPLLELRGVSIAFPSPQGPVSVVENASFELAAGETVGIVGESGCGKSVTAMSVIGLLPGNGYIAGGQIIFDGRDLAALSETELRKVRGKQIGVVSQEPTVALNPVYRVGEQLAHRLRFHHGLSRRAASKRAVELLARVHLPDPEAVARRYPHELSGGMAQRVAIARALSGDPKLLIADEPTTALDVTIQAEILELLRELQREQGMATLLVTHDWGVIADISERVVVMYAGQVVERAEIAPIFRRPLHPYTQALLASNPYYSSETEMLPTIPGTVPRPGDWPTGCHFHPRCAYATADCRQRPIPLEHVPRERETRCIHHEELLAVQ